MKKRIMTSALASLCLLASPAWATGQVIDIPAGPDYYASSVEFDGPFIGWEQSAQSFIALGSQLTAVSTAMYEQRSDVAVFWRYELWDDVGGHPNQIIAAFGSFNPGLTLSSFSVTLDSPIPLVTGQRYYLGLGLDPTKPVPGYPGGFGASNILVQGWSTTDTQDAYADGTLWAIANPGSAGEYLLEPVNYDYSMRISMVPEPTAAWLLTMGAVTGLAVGSRRRRDGERMTARP